MRCRRCWPITGELLDLKHRALRAHASQTRGLENLVGTKIYRRWWSSESFVAYAEGRSRGSVPLRRSA